MSFLKFTMISSKQDFVIRYAAYVSLQVKIFKERRWNMHVTMIYTEMLFIYQVLILVKTPFIIT